MHSNQGDYVYRLWRVYGRVQRVGFRAFARRHALALGISGYARNMPDGSVEVLAQGDPEAVNNLRARLQRGPRRAKVELLVDVSLNDTMMLDYGNEFLVR